MEQKTIAKMTGYKATNADLTCQGYQFKVGEWHEHPGGLKLCPNSEDVQNGLGGFHFCVHPSGVHCYYSNNDSRVFTVEAEEVLEVPIEAGADFKLVARRIRLVEEITPGKCGTNESNTGDRNTGDRNTGNRNTGDQNTGNWNTGDRNTGDQNTGDQNTGDQNTGDQNTGNWNTGDRSCGVFCQQEPKVISFDIQTKLTLEQFLKKYPEAYTLGCKLCESAPIDWMPFKNIPGITKKKLAALHAVYQAKLQKKL